MNFPAHECELILHHNENRSLYKTVAEFLEDREDPNYAATWQSPEHRARAIATNELWELQWYPVTPIGFLNIWAPTLAELLAFANSADLK
jgi:hypothetical protein